MTAEFRGLVTVAGRGALISSEPPSWSWIWGYAGIGPFQRRLGVGNLSAGLLLPADSQARSGSTLDVAQLPDGGAAGGEADGGGGAGSSGHRLGRWTQFTDVRPVRTPGRLTERRGRLYRYLLEEHPGEDFVGPPVPRLLSGHRGPPPGKVCEVPGHRAGTPGAGVSAEGAGPPDQLKAGFEEQLSQLMASERFDAEADMKVMEGLLNTEGFQWEANQNGSV